MMMMMMMMHTHLVLTSVRCKCHPTPLRSCALRVASRVWCQCWPTLAPHGTPTCKAYIVAAAHHMPHIMAPFTHTHTYPHARLHYSAAARKVCSCAAGLLYSNAQHCPASYPCQGCLAGMSAVTMGHQGAMPPRTLVAQHSATHKHMHHVHS
jgi:hypothetical protein